jgi:hypothetical protein
MPFFVSSDCGYPDGTDLEAPDASRKKAAAGSVRWITFTVTFYAIVLTI